MRVPPASGALQAEQRQHQDQTPSVTASVSDSVVQAHVDQGSCSYYVGSRATAPMKTRRLLEVQTALLAA